MPEYVLSLECDERRGIVHSLTGALLDHGGDIRELKQFDARHAAEAGVRKRSPQSR